MVFFPFCDTLLCFCLQYDIEFKRAFNHSSYSLTVSVAAVMSIFELNILIQHTLSSSHERADNLEPAEVNI